MKLRTISYCIKEGMINAFRNKLMSIASISTIGASLVLFGVFIIISQNVDYNSKALISQPEMQVFCKYELDGAQLIKVQDEISKNPEVESSEVVTKQDAFKKAKDILRDDSNLLDELGYDFLPVSFIVKLKNPEKSEIVAEEFKKIKGVETVEYSKKQIFVVNTILKWVKYFSAVLTALFSIVSVLIIANTIRLAVFARRKEINIMKYIGATDWFIRWPFIVEGIIIGIIGSTIGFGIVISSYDYVLKNYLVELEGVLTFIDIWSISQNLAVAFLIIGVVVGSIGSAISIRRYLKV